MSNDISGEKIAIYQIVLVKKFRLMYVVLKKYMKNIIFESNIINGLIKGLNNKINKENGYIMNSVDRRIF